MQVGEGRLTEITTPSPWGEIKMLQALFVEGNTAYIITGAALKQEFAKFQSDFLNTFRSLSLIPDLFAPLSEDKKSQFQFLLSGNAEDTEENQWQKFQEMTANCPEMGTHWHFLVLQQGYSKIFQKEKPKLR